MRASPLKRPGSHIVLNIQSGKAPKTYRFRSIKRLKHKLHTMIGKERYIVQQGILLCRIIEKRPFDLRVLVQKNERGVWSLTGIGARSPAAKSITTHVPRGGSIDDPKKLLSAYSVEEAERILRRVSIGGDQASLVRSSREPIRLGRDVHGYRRRRQRTAVVFRSQFKTDEIR